MAGGFERVVAIDSGPLCALKACSKTSRRDLSAQTRHDIVGVSRIRQWARGKLLLMDLGYYSFEVFESIDQSGGWFVSRMKSSTNPRILEDCTPGAGRFMKLEGLKLKSAAKMEHALGSFKRRAGI